MPLRTVKVNLRNVIPKGTPSLMKFLSKFEEKKCILLKHPFGFLPWSMISSHGFKNVEPLLESDFQLIKEVIKATSRPAKIKSLAEKIVSIIKFEGLKEHKMAALHWRYDLDDWGAGNDGTLSMQKVLAVRERPILLARFIEEELCKKNISRLVIFSPPRKGSFFAKLYF